jgi:hypothetical protein
MPVISFLPRGFSVDIFTTFGHPMVLAHPWTFVGIVAVAAYLLSKDFKHALTLMVVVFLALLFMHGA